MSRKKPRQQWVLPIGGPGWSARCSRLRWIMFCPQCKAEYRQGFTRCADCGVELVHGLPGAEEGASNDMRAGTLVPLWEGEDLALHTTLLEELEAAGIRYYDRPMGVYPGVRRWDPFPIQPMTRFGYQVAVLSADLPSAEKTLERLLMEKPQDMDLPANEEKQGETTGRVAHPGEETICEIWMRYSSCRFTLLFLIRWQ